MNSGPGRLRWLTPLDVACFLLVMGSPLYAQQPRLRQKLVGHGSAVWAVAFSRDGKTLASGSWDKTVKLWDAASGKSTATFQNPGSVSVCFSPDGGVVASGSRVRMVQLWSVGAGKATALQGETKPTFGVAFSPDGKMLALGCAGGAVQLWDVPSAGKAGR